MQQRLCKYLTHLGKHQDNGCIMIYMLEYDFHSCSHIYISNTFSWEAQCTLWRPILAAASQSNEIITIAVWVIESLVRILNYMSPWMWWSLDNSIVYFGRYSFIYPVCPHVFFCLWTNGMEIDKYYKHCSAIMMKSVFTKIPTIDTPYLDILFWKSNLYSMSVNAVVYEISWYTGQRYNGTWLYYRWEVMVMKYYENCLV